MQEVGFASAQADTASTRPELSVNVPEPVSIASLLGASVLVLTRRRRQMA